MRRLSACSALAAIILATTMSGCAGADSAASLFGDTTGASKLATRGHAGSWMLPEARGENLLYVSDNWSVGLVYVFAYPGGKHVGTLTGFSFPTGECIDKRGDVWVLNVSPEEVIEFAHGGTTPIATLDNPIGGFSCSIDPTSGDLAVSSDNSEVAIYKNAAGTPTIYTYSGAADLFSCAYDGRGNLFIDSPNAPHPFAELPKGGNTFIPIKYPNDAPLLNMQWDGRYLAVQEEINGIDANRGPAKIARVQVVGSTATIVGTTLLYGNRNKQEGSAVQFWIEGDRITEPTPGRGGADPVVETWKYPAGGTHVAAERARHSYFLLGVAVSPKR